MSIISDNDNLLSCPGHYSDGKSADQQTVTVTISNASLQIFFPETQEILAWPYSELTSLHPLQQGHDIWLNLKAETPKENDKTDYSRHARLFLADCPHIQKLLEKAPALSLQSSKSRVLKPMYWISATTALLGIIAYSINLSHIIAVSLPHSTRALIGDKVIAGMTSQENFCSSPKGNAALEKIRRRLVQSSNRPEKFSVRVAKLGMLNAFATPGERIILSKKMLEFVQSPEELAGVLAHEMGHGIKLHPETGIINAMGLAVAFQWVLGNNGGTLSDMGSLFLMMKNSRDTEREADAVGMGLLKKAKINKKGEADFYRRLHKEHEIPEDILSEETQAGLNILSTHPASKERLKTIEDTPDWTSTLLLSDTEWKDLKAICSNLETETETQK